MNLAGLFDYQAEAAPLLLDALRRNGAALDASDMGTGKTANALAVIRELRLPTLAIVPRISITGWRDLGKHLDVDEFDIESIDLVRGGNTPFGWWDHPRPKVMPEYLKCTACQCVVNPAEPFPCVHGPDGIHCVKVHKHEHKYGRFNWHEGIKLLVIDEVHRFCGIGSLNEDMLLAATRQKIPTLMLSATVAESPMNLRAIGYALGLHKFTDFYPWAMKRGCFKLPVGGFEFCVAEEKRASIMAGIHADLFPSRGCRVTVASLGKRFPECQITAELLDFDDAAKIGKLHGEMAAELAKLEKASELEMAATVALRGYQRIELLKVPELLEWTKEQLAAGRSVALFVVFRATVDALCKRLGTDCRIDGSQPADVRAANVAAFQANQEHVIVSTGAAGGFSINLQDLHGRPRSGGVLPGFSAKEFRQTTGRLPRAGAKSKSLYRVFFAAGTDEEHKYKVVRSKLDCLDALNDGDLNPGNLRLTERPEYGNLV